MLNVLLTRIKSSRSTSSSYVNRERERGKLNVNNNLLFLYKKCLHNSDDDQSKTLNILAKSACNIPLLGIRSFRHMLDEGACNLAKMFKLMFAIFLL